MKRDRDRYLKPSLYEGIQYNDFQIIKGGEYNVQEI